jgi:hypothetical protein
MTAVTGGRAAVRRLLQRLVWWRVGLQWLAVAVLLIPLGEVLVAVALGSPDALRALTPAALQLYPAAYFWHFFLYVPAWFQSGVVDGLAGLGVFVVSTTATTATFTWLFNNTKTSVLLAILLHGSIDGTATYMQVLADKGVISEAGASNSIVIGAVIASVVWAVLLTAVTRGRLSISATGTRPSSSISTPLRTDPQHRPSRRRR